MVGNVDRVDEHGNTYELPLSEMEAQTGPIATEQIKWLAERMEASTADYLWVGGHYPVWAIGQDGPTPVRALLRGLLNKWEAHYFNGHQHDLEHIVEPGLKVNYISTGAAHSCCYSDSNLGTVPAGSIKFAMSGNGGAMWWGRAPPPFQVLSGFTSYRIGAESMQVHYHAHNGTELYVTPPILARTKKPQPKPPPPGTFCTKSTCPPKTRPPTVEL